MTHVTAPFINPHVCCFPCSPPLLDALRIRKAVQNAGGRQRRAALSAVKRGDEKYTTNGATMGYSGSTNVHNGDNNYEPNYKLEGDFYTNK